MKTIRRETSGKMAGVRKIDKLKPEMQEMIRKIGRIEYRGGKDLNGCAEK
jgi:hypothetical protein